MSFTLFGSETCIPTHLNPMAFPMKLSFLKTSFLGSALCAVATTIQASDVTPIGTHVSDQSGAVFFGPGLGITEFGPGVGEPITSARLDVTFNANGSTPASDLLLTYSLPVDGGTSFWSVTGSDLGFPSAFGTFTGSVETDLLNGTVHNPSPFPFVPFEVGIQSTSGDLFGTAVELRLTLDIGPRMRSDVSQISLTTGGQQQLTLEAGPSAGAGLLYFMVGSFTGTTPGISFGGIRIPVNNDAYTKFLLKFPNIPPFSSSVGNLDGNGQATASYTLPVFDPALAGIQLHHCFLLFDNGLNLLSASNAVPLEFTL